MLFHLIVLHLLSNAAAQSMSKQTVYSLPISHNSEVRNNQQTRFFFNVSEGHKDVYISVATCGIEKCFDLSIAFMLQHKKDEKQFQKFQPKAEVKDFLGRTDLQVHANVSLPGIYRLTFSHIKNTRHCSFDIDALLGGRIPTLPKNLKSHLSYWLNEPVFTWKNYFKGTPVETCFQLILKQDYDKCDACKLIEGKSNNGGGHCSKRWFKHCRNDGLTEMTITKGALNYGVYLAVVFIKHKLLGRLNYIPTQWEHKPEVLNEDEIITWRLAGGYSKFIQLDPEIRSMTLVVEVCHNKVVLKMCKNYVNLMNTTRCRNSFQDSVPLSGGITRISLENIYSIKLKPGRKPLILRMVYLHSDVENPLERIKHKMNISLINNSCDEGLEIVWHAKIAPAHYCVHIFPYSRKNKKVMKEWGTCLPETSKELENGQKHCQYNSASTSSEGNTMSVKIKNLHLRKKYRIDLYVRTSFESIQTDPQNVYRHVLTKYFHDKQC